MNPAKFDELMERARYLGVVEDGTMKGILIFAFLVLVSLLGACADTSAHERRSTAAKSSPLFRVLKGQKFGYMNRAGELVIEPQFDEAGDFEGEHALVKQNGHSRIIDKNGKKVPLPNGFEVINSFSDGLARGNLQTTSPFSKVYINVSGKLISEDLRLGGACPFSEGLACVQLGKWGYIDTSGKLVIPSTFDEASPFSEGLASVTVWDHSKASRHKSGFIDRTGRVVIEPIFDVAQSFSEGVAAVGERADDGYRFGFIDKSGKLVIKPEFQWTYGFAEGMAAVRIGDKWGFVDRTGKLIMKPLFDEAEAFSEGVAAVRLNGKWGFVDKAGNFVIEPQFSEAYSFRYGLAMVSKNAKNYDDLIGHFDTEGDWGYIDRAGKYVWEPTR